MWKLILGALPILLFIYIYMGVHGWCDGHEKGWVVSIENQSISFDLIWVHH